MKLSVDLQEVIDYCRGKKEIGLDIETSRKYPRGTYREDIYSPGLDPLVSRIVMVQIGDLNQQFVIDARTTDIMPLKEILEDKTILKIGHNLKFEGLHFLTYGIRIVNVWDTMITEKILYNGARHSYSLEALASRYLGTVSKVTLFDIEDEADYEGSVLDLIDRGEIKYVDKSIRTAFVNIGDRPFTQSEIEYGADDIIFPLKIKKIQEKGRMINGISYYPERGIRMENQYTQDLAEMSFVGMPFDSEMWMSIYESTIPIREKRKKVLDEYVTSTFPQFAGTLNLFSQESSCPFDWHSPAQTINFFRRGLDWCPKEISKSTGKLDYTVGASVLYTKISNKHKEKFNKDIDPETIESRDDFILAYLLFKKSAMLTSTFGEDWLRFVHPVTGRIHPNYNQYMHSGRLSCNNPNLQNIPATEEHRACFHTKEGQYIGVADYSAQESRILAEVSNNELMMSFFISGHPEFGTDSHSYAATMMFRVIYGDPEWTCDKEVHKTERDASKTISFGISYGGGAKSLAGRLGIPEEEAESFLEAYFDSWNGLKEDFEATRKKAVECGWIELDPYTNKRYFFPDFEEMKSLKAQALAYFPEDYREWPREQREEFKVKLRQIPKYKQLWKDYAILKGSLERKALNYRIQGAAATVSKLAHMLINKSRRLNPHLVYQVINMVHDEADMEFFPSAPLDEERLLEAKEAAGIVEACMLKAGSIVFPKVPLPASCKVTNRWEK